MLVIMIWEGSKISYSRMLVFLGGLVTVVFGLLSAFVRGLAYGIVYVSPGSMVSPRVYFPHFYFQTHDFTLGMLVSSIGGLLGLISSVKHFNKLISIGYIGGIMGVLGFLLTSSGFSIHFPQENIASTFLG